MDYAKFIIKQNKKELYSEAEKYLLHHYDINLNFPFQKYLANAMLSIINKEKGDKEKAKHYKRLAEDAVVANVSGFVHSTDEGLVVERDKILDKMMG